MIKRIVIAGPESTGKSALSAALASALDTLWCPEHARAYLEKHGPGYDYETVGEIGAGQEILLQHYSQAIAGKTDNSILLHGCRYTAQGTSVNQAPWLVADTDALVIQVWQEYVFGKCRVHTLSSLAAPEPEEVFYLLCAPDLPWTYDPLREYPEGDHRERLFFHYHALLSAGRHDFGIVRGTGSERVANALRLFREWQERDRP